MNLQLRKSMPILMAATFLSLGGCSSGTTTPNSGGGFTSQGILTVDSSATYPVINGAHGYATAIIHNDSEEDAKNIRLTLGNNIDNKTIPLVTSCTSIAAHGGICTVNIPVPAGINEKTRSGAALLNINYTTAKGKKQINNGLINFQYLDNPQAGVHISPTVLSNFGKVKSRSVAYVYAGGNAGTLYHISRMQSTNPGFDIRSGDLTGLQMMAGNVQAVEIEGVAPNYIEKTDLDIDAQSSGVPYTEKMPIAVMPKAGNNAFPSLDASFTPIRDIVKDDAKASAKIYFINDGNAVLHPKLAGLSDGITLDSTTCKDEIPAGNVCEVDVTLPMTASLKHSTLNITDTKYNDVNAVASLVWFSSSGELEQVALALEQDYLVLGNNQTKVTVHVTNIGGQATFVKPQDAEELFDSEDLSGIVDKTTLDGQNGHCSQDSPLDIGGNCSYDVNFSTTSTKPDAHTALLKVENSDGKVTGEQRVKWTITNTDFPDITMAPNPVDIHDIAGSNTSRTKNIKLINTAGGGKTRAAAKVEQLYLDKTDTLQALSVAMGDCSNKIAPGTFCTAKLSLNTGSDPEVNLEATANLIASGNFNDESDPISYGLRPKDWGLQLDIAYSDDLTGKGTLDDPLIVSGAAAGEKLITMTITNIGTESQILKGIKNWNQLDPSLWDIDYSQSSCLSSASSALNKSLAVQDSCSIIFKNIYGQQHGYADSDITKSSGVAFPRLIVMQADNSYTSTTPIQKTPESDLDGMIHVANQQAVISNHLARDPNQTNKITITHSINNGSNYVGNVKAIAKVPEGLFDIGSFAVETGSDCSRDMKDGFLVLSCNLSTDKPTGTYSIKANNTFLSEDYLLAVLFDYSVPGNGMIVGMDNWAESVVLTKSN